MTNCSFAKNSITFTFHFLKRQIQTLGVVTLFNSIPLASYVHLILVETFDKKQTFHFFWVRQIRTLGMLRSRFDSIPLAFNSCLIPVETSDTKRKKGLRSYLHNRFKEVPFVLLIYFCKLQMAWLLILCIFFLLLMLLFRWNMQTRRI